MHAKQISSSLVALLFIKINFLLIFFRSFINYIVYISKKYLKIKLIASINQKKINK